jgi:HEAT repeat protein
MGLRYQAVFQLKNINTEESIKKLLDAYPHLSDSVLLSHEVLYTLGQLKEDKVPILKDFLISVVNDENDNNLSRH